MFVNDQPENGSFDKNRLSDSTIDSECSLRVSQQNVQFSPRITVSHVFQFCRTELMLNKIDQPQITQRTTSKAINWLVSTCWTNNFDDETLYLAIILFYCYKANRVIPKAQLELILLTIIFISSKKASVEKMKAVDILTLGSQSYSLNDLIDIESDILCLVDFNLEFQTTISEFLWQRNCGDQQINKVLLLTQLSLFESSDYFFEQDLFEDIVNLVLNNGPLTNSLQTIVKRTNLKQTQIITNKFGSKLDVEDFLNHLSNKLY